MFKSLKAFALSAVIALSCLCGRAATVSWSTTNWVYTPLKRATVLSQVSDTPLSDGSYIIAGPPQRFPDTNAGTWSTILYAGNYRLDIDGLPFAKPLYF